MEIDNARDLEYWITEGSLLEGAIDNVEGIIRAFSEFIYSVDSEYLYNKTFLDSFIEDFLRSTEMLSIKKNFLEELLDELSDYKDEIQVDVDGAWIFDMNHDGVYLSNRFSSSKINSVGIEYQIKHLSEPSFVIARKSTVDDIENEIERVVELFNSRVEENE